MSYCPKDKVAKIACDSPFQSHQKHNYFQRFNVITVVLVLIQDGKRILTFY